MLSGLWGRKIGMTQIFANNAVVPITVIDVNCWFVTQIKTQENDGYKAVQIGLVKNKYVDQGFDANWLKKKKDFFTFMREVKYDTLPADLAVGVLVDPKSFLESGMMVDVTGESKGRGFQGVVKRHGFAGGRASHGPRFGRWPGSIGNMRAHGRVLKGKKLPGHMGTETTTIQKLEVVRIEQDSNVVMIKGSVPGGTGALVYLQKV